MHNSRQVVYVAFVNDHVYLSIYLSTQPKRVISTNPIAPMKTMKSQKLVDLANQQILHFVYVYSSGIRLQYDIHPIILIAI